MVKLLLQVRRERFWVIAFKDVATAILSRCKADDRITVTGTAGINSWKDDEGEWHNDFQVSAWSAEIQGDKVSFQRKEEAPVKDDTEPPLPDEPTTYDLGDYDYQDGPF